MPSAISSGLTITSAWICRPPGKVTTRVFNCSTAERWVPQAARYQDRQQQGGNTHGLNMVNDYTHAAGK